MNIRALKTILWFLLGAGLTVIALRIIHGPGAVVALTDLMPWGLWKGGGVVALVPIGGAGFTLAAFVSIFHWKRYKPLYLGAVLLGLMCYSSVGAGLTFDIGIWWRIVFPVWHWQFHSTLFEISWCIMLYLMVLTVEFSHTVLEKFEFHRAARLLDRFGIVFVVAGICLSTLHQSSLGTLFLATPFRLHPLWHTDLLPFLFFITSIGLGCLTISWVTILAHRLYGAEPPMKAISGLARISAYVLGLYVVVRFAGIIATGKGGLLFTPSWDTANFWFEILLSAAVPVALMMNERFRVSSTAMLWISTAGILGMSLNRINVAGLATVSTTNQFYFPAWTEWTVTFGILAGAALVFLFCVERFNVFEAVDEDRLNQVYSPRRVDQGDWRTIFFQNRWADVRVYSVSLVFAVGLALLLMPEEGIFGLRPEETPVRPPRIVEVSNDKETDVAAVRYSVQMLEETQNDGANRILALMIDGNRDGDYVLFDHEAHVTKQGGGDETCVSCHHMQNPYEQVSECSSCHSDMYLAVDIFDHDTHVEHKKGNEGCVECHTDPSAEKVRETAKDCGECHETMRPEGTRVDIAKDQQTTVAPSYMDALHEGCISCHEEEMETREETNGEQAVDLTTCTNCHRDLPRLEDEQWKARL